MAGHLGILTRSRNAPRGCSALADERSNDAVLSLVERTCGLDDFVEDAVSADGRGHFLSHYDGEENEQGEYFIYRLN